MICGLLRIGGAAQTGRQLGRGQPQLRSNFAAKRRWTVGADSISKGLTVGVPTWAGCLWEPLALARVARLLLPAVGEKWPVGFSYPFPDTKRKGAFGFLLTLSEEMIRRE